MGFGVEFGFDCCCFVLFLILFYVYECDACMYISVPVSCSAHGGQKRVSDPPELELLTVISHHVGAGIPTPARALNH